jgi:hypothetical protein
MNFLTGLVLFFASMVIVSQVAPIVGDMQRAKEAKAAAVVFNAKQHESMIKACATGHTSYIMYNGAMCKGVE